MWIEFFQLTQPFLFAIVGGVVVAFVNHLLTRERNLAESRKFAAETQKLAKEAEKFELEITQLKTDASAIKSNVESLETKISVAVEKVIYDSESHDLRIDVQGKESQFYSEAKNAFDGPVAQGSLKFEGGLLNLRRTNKEGNYWIILKKYIYDGINRDFIPENIALDGKRFLKIVCKVKVILGEHTVALVLKNHKNGNLLGEKSFKVQDNGWVVLDACFEVRPDLDCHFRIDDRYPSSENSSLQIMYIKVSEMPQRLEVKK